MERSNARDFYADVVLSALQERLDAAFPEFGWKRDRQGWVATNQEFTHRALGVRADRVVAHGPAPRGFLIHGGDPVLWTAYLNGGVTPRGQVFVNAVRELAGRAGVDPAPLDRPQPRDRRAELLNDVFLLARRELASERGVQARDYLTQRGFPTKGIVDSGLGGLGVMPDPHRLRVALEGHGYSGREIAASGVLTDSRWPGRIVGCWRDERGNAKTLWARTTHDEESSKSKYLYLRGVARRELPPYELSTILDAPWECQRGILLVEGVMDVHLLRAHGIDTAGALGGTSTRPALFQTLARLGIENVTLCLDNDPAGRLATARAIEHAARAETSPALFVVDPAQLGATKDPDGRVRTHGINAFRELIATRVCGITWRALEHTRGLGPDSSQAARRSALARAGSWLGVLPRRLALEQEDAIRAVAERCGYSAPAVERAYRARFWRNPESPGSRRREPTLSRDLER